MKVAMTAAPQVHLTAWSCPAADAPYRVAGLLIAVGVPTLFWTLALVLVTKGVGVSIGAPALAAFGSIVAAWCLVGASLVMSNRG